MPAFIPAGARVRQELAVAIVEGQGAIQGLIGKKILPDYGINRRTAHIIKATLADTLGLRTIADAKYLRAPGTKFERMVAKFGDDTFTVTLRGAEIVVPNETEMDLAGYLDVESFFAARFGQTSALTQEYLIAQAIFNTTNFGAATNSTAAYTLANSTYAAYTAGTGLSFFSDVIAAIRRVRAQGEQPDTVVMSGPVFERIRQAVTPQQYATGLLLPGQNSTLNTVQQALAEYGIKQVLVANGYTNTAADGAAPNLGLIWSNTYIWVGKAGEAFGSTKNQNDPEDGGIGVPTLQGVGANIYWEGYAPGGVVSADKDSMTFEGGNYVESYPDLTIDSMVIRVKVSAQPYIGNPRAGTLIATQYS